MKNLILCALIFVSIFPKNTHASPKDKFIRVAIVQNEKELRLSIRGGYEIVNPLNGLKLKDGRRMHLTTVTIEKEGIKMGKTVYPYRRIRIKSKNDVTIKRSKGEARYRGIIDIIRDKQNQFLVVNSIEMESYIKGVLYHEVSHRWPIEAIKAQAVAARSYALYQAKVNETQEFDVRSDIYSQVYGGRSAERYRTNIATNKTKGEVLFYQGKILPAYFHSTCGGHTENASELWDHNLTPLKGVVCPFCSLSPHYEWKKNFQLKFIQDQLNQHNYRLGLIKEIKVSERSSSGRVRKVQIVGRDGQTETISGKEFRNIIGPNEFKSNYYNVVMRGYFFDLVGKGWGHGVGMCQWGAYGMALERYKYIDILQYYYQGAQIQSIEGLN